MMEMGVMERERGSGEGRQGKRAWGERARGEGERGKMGKRVRG